MEEDRCLYKLLIYFYLLAMAIQVGFYSWFNALGSAHFAQSIGIIANAVLLCASIFLLVFWGV